MTAPSLLLLRYCITIGVMGALLKVRGVPLQLPAGPRWGALLHAAFLVATSFGYLGSIQVAPLSLAVLILYTMTAWSILLGHYLGMDRLTAGKAVAALLAIVGVGFTVGVDFNRVSVAGLVLALGASVCYALVTTVGKWASSGSDPMMVNLYAGLMGAPLAAGAGLLMGNLVVPPGALALGATIASSALYLLGFSLVLAGLQLTLPSRASITMTLEPLITVLLSVLLVGEPLSTGIAIGGTLILMAVLLTTSSAQRQVQANAEGKMGA